MIDGIQINNLKCDTSNIDFQIKVNTRTGETASKQTATHKGLYIVLYPNNRVRLSGSLTTYTNGNNIVNLNYWQICNTVNVLCNELSISPETTVLNGLEIGLNVPIPYSPDLFLNELIAWRKIEPQRWLGRKENYVQFKNSQTTLKIYSKSKQYNLSDNLLRYELRIDKMEYAHKQGVKTLSDLTDKAKLKSLSNVLLSTFNDLIYYDETIELQELKKVDLNLLEKGNNSRYWGNKNLHRNTFSHNKTKFQNLVREYGKRNFHNIKNLIQSKRDELLKTSCKMTDFNTKVKNKNFVQNDTLNSVSNCKCIVTNYPKIISQQNGKYLTPKDIEYYYKHDKNIYSDLVERFNSTSYKQKDYTKMELKPKWVQMAKRIRSKTYNPRNNTRNNTRKSINRVLNERTESLFDNWLLISDNKKELAQINY